MTARTIRLGLLTLLVALVFPSGARGQDHATEPAAEGIQVHGHWIIEVYDGNQLIERREFENALESTGSATISELLAGESSVGTWLVHISNDVCASDADGSPVVCNLVPEGDDCSYCGAPSHTLSVSTPESGEDAGKLILEGSFTADFDDAIEIVSTDVGPCSASTAPSDCSDINLENGRGFTERFLSSPISVKAGQLVNVRVEISFE